MNTIRSYSFLNHKKMKNFCTLFLTIIFTIFSSFWMPGQAKDSDQRILNDGVKNSVSLYHFEFNEVMSWFLSPENSLAIICPSNQVINLKSGECGTVVNFGWTTTDINAQSVKYFQNNDTSLVNSTYYCPSGQTKYSRIFDNGSPTDVTVKYVKIGVYESSNSPLVTLNFYDEANVLLGSQSAIIPNLSKTVYRIDIPNTNIIKLPALKSYRLEVVVNPPVVSVFKMGRNNGGNSLGYSDATMSSSCSSFTYIYEGLVGGDATVMVVNGIPDDYSFTKTNTTLSSGDYFPIGTYNMDYVVTDANGSNTACPFTIVVNEFSGITNVMACQDLVQVSLDDDCQTLVTSDMILQGDNYGCPDNYEVKITATNGKNLGNTVDYTQHGKTLKVQVINQQGNSCWGEILVQDKKGPELHCEDIYATCSTDLRPGSPLSARIPVSAALPNRTIPDNAYRQISVIVDHLPGTSITDLNVYLDITHPNISQLAATITSPDGVTVPLFDGLTCNGADAMLTFDDQSTALYNELINSCANPGPAAAGTFRSLLPLSVFNGKPLEGEWIINVFDKAVGSTGFINHADIIFTQTGGIVPFPVENPGTFVELGDNFYQLSKGDNCNSATLLYTDTVEEEDCSSTYAKVIKRCWSGKDAIGNAANECCQYIYVYRNGLSTLEFPPNFDGINGNPQPLSCKDYQDVLPGTDVTGLPSGDLCANVQLVPPTDITIQICENSYKIIRTHKVVEWCSGQVIVHNQIIKVVDDQGPQMNCPKNVTVSANEYDCYASYVAQVPEIVFECSDKIAYDLSFLHESDYNNEYHSYEGVNQVGHSIQALPFGDNKIFWKLTDACGNISECSYIVTVKDLVSPTAVCDRHTIAALTGNGTAVIEATSFDDGSLDNCGIKLMEARKMTDICNNNTSFGSEVLFCCSEVGTTVMVEFRVTDLSNNQNTCMVEVSVQDKLPPYITKCPADITLDCQTDYNDFKVTGYPEYVDNCSIKSVKNQDDAHITNCGVGTVARTWTVTDAQDYRHSCVQNITLYDRNPFVESDITWPQNYTTNKCYSNLDPDALPSGYDRPTFKDDYCSLVAATYEDQVFKFVDGACEKILRTWTIIDWCTYDDSNPSAVKGLYQKIQIIKLINDIAPSFEFSCVDRSFKSFGPCEENISFSMSAVDDCPEDNTDLIWKYELDLDSDGTFEYTGTGNKFNRVLKNGKHTVRWTVEDKCGNRSFCTHTVDVVESKKPTPYCLSSLTTAVMNSDGTISIWAKDYDKGSYDNCTPTADLIFTFYGAVPNKALINQEHYFKGNGVVATKAEYLAGGAQIWIPSKRTSGIIFDCNDIPDGVSQEITLSMWVTDLAGNQDYCDVTIVLQDNSNFCKDGLATTRVIGGGMKTANARPIDDIQVIMSSNKPELNKTIVTDNDGNFQFDQIPTGSNVQIKAYDNRDLLNGVSTLDLVHIQRHILGIQSLNDPYNAIAADADNNGKISASDLTVIRKAILGISSSFSNGQTSWRFIPASQHFADPNAPFPFIETYTFDNVASDKFGQDFIGVKIGDVNNSVQPFTSQKTTSRSENVLSLYSPSIEIDKDKANSIDIVTKESIVLSGLQMTIQVDPSQVDIEEITSELDGWSSQNYSLHSFNEGYITISWNTQEAVTIPANYPLFRMRFQGKDVGKLKMNLSSDITSAEAYDDTYDTYRIDWRAENQNDVFEVLQNMPNPFSDMTYIPVYLPEDDALKMEVTDVTGKIVFTQQQYLTKGHHQLLVKNSDLGKTGVYLCKIESQGDIKTIKMIVIK